MNEACVTRAFAMMKECRYSCNFCKHELRFYSSSIHSFLFTSFFFTLKQVSNRIAIIKDTGGIYSVNYRLAHTFFLRFEYTIFKSTLKKVNGLNFHFA